MSDIIMKDHVKAAVIGHPIGHSKSPLIHNYWIDVYKMNGSYEAIDIAPENFEDEIKRIIDEGYAGFNVTIPHKETILKLCDEVATNAEAIGAVNTIKIEDGKLIGKNTDGFGFTHNIWDAHPDFEFVDKTAVVLGAGGATRAIVSALLGEQIRHIILVNRTKEKAQIIADEMNFLSDVIQVADWDDRHAALKGCDILVNATSLGMNGQPFLELDISSLPKDALVSDIVYAPLETPLLMDAKARGNPIVTGIGMLIHQARPAFKEWFGVLPDVTPELQQKVLG